ncbi:molecular chaperone HscB [Puccinia sorghi]|uniref:Molecular chaperone HscB n=1 Tax=Puccinia sorghi TaxID=27349 RepID=A0A0L6VG03_9BASI|nr:molecular chaperone HscB [Puccinia sorghi]
MEQQNDERLEALYSKISSIKNVTIDIHSDSQSQNRLLNTTLSDSANRFSRTLQAGSSQRKVIVYAVGSVVVIFFLFRLFR